MKFLRICHLYPAVENTIKARISEKAYTYSEIKSAIFSLQVGFSDSFEYYLSLNYNFECETIFPGIPEVQDIWFKENGVRKENASISYQISQIQPNIVFIEDIGIVNDKTILELKERKVLLVGHHCSPFDDTIIDKLKLLNLVITCSPRILNDFNSIGIVNSRLIYHGFDKRFLKSMNENVTKCEELIFSGSLISGNNFHDDRLETLQFLIENNIDVSLYSSYSPLKEPLKNELIIKNAIKIFGRINAQRILYRMGIDIDLEPVQNYLRIKKYLHPPLFGSEMYHKLANSAICINIHGGVAGPFAANMRLFEATGAGTCLVTDAKMNLSDLFEVDKECIAFNSKEEALEKIRYLKNNPTVREEIALNGKKRCLEKHSMELRVNEFYGMLAKI